MDLSLSMKIEKAEPGVGVPCSTSTDSTLIEATTGNPGAQTSPMARAQSFTAGSGGTALTAVTVDLGSTIATGTATLSIQTSSSSLPSNTTVADSEVVHTLVGSDGQTEFVFDEPIQLSASTEYWIVVAPTGGATIYTMYDTGSVDGNYAYTADGSSWTAVGTFDLKIKIEGCQG